MPDLKEELRTAILKNLSLSADSTDKKINTNLLKELVGRYVENNRILKKMNEDKNRFLGITSHDLRNPLSTIRGFSELLLEDPDMDEEQKTDFLRRINAISEEMLNLIQNLLDISFIESGKLTINKKPVDLVKLVESRMDTLRHSATVKNISCNPSFPSSSTVMGDRERLIQVVDNLLSNAVKYSNPGAQVTVVVRPVNNTLLLEVADGGNGIPEGQEDRLFKEYEKLDSRPTGGEPSTGLGLAIAKKIIEAHGGEIGFSRDNPYTSGALFFVSLPVQ